MKCECGKKYVVSRDKLIEYIPFQNMSMEDIERLARAIEDGILLRERTGD